VGIVWVHMVPSDSRFTAGLAARRMVGPSVRQFHDPGNLVGRALAEGLGAPGKVAWDIYLFYAPGMQWGAGPPTPQRWAHQLSDSWADPARYRPGGRLRKELRLAMEEIGQ
jgi:hypothetical protein